MALNGYSGVRSFFLGGGVISNKYILRDILKLVRSRGLRTVYPDKKYRTDNAAMIGLCAALNIENKTARILEKAYDITAVERVPVLDFNLHL